MAYYCPNPACPERRAEHRIFRLALVDGYRRVRRAGVRLLLNSGLIEDEADLFALDGADLLGLEGFAEKKVQNLLASIRRQRPSVAARLIGALGIRGVEATPLRGCWWNTITAWMSSRRPRSRICRRSRAWGPTRQVRSLVVR